VPDKRDLTASDYRALGTFRFHIRRFLHFSETAAHAEGLEPQQHQMLLAIRALEGPSTPPTVGQLAGNLFIRHQSAVGLVDRLAERGLVERSRGSEDRRQVQVRLTHAGSRILRRLSEIHREELKQIAPALVETLSGLLESAR
jgi:DNA-binding MarR family transcriptional regulator